MPSSTKIALHFPFTLKKFLPNHTHTHTHTHTHIHTHIHMLTSDIAVGFSSDPREREVTMLFMT